VNASSSSSARKSAFALAFGLCLGACAEVPVVQGVGETEANRVVATLDQAGIAARKEADEGGGNGAATFRVTVGMDEVAPAVATLEAHSLPRREEPGFAETFGQASLVQTASEERARASQAIAGELARTIETIDGVLDARVHLALPDTRELPLDGTTLPRASASVLVRYLGTHAPYREEALQRLVAGAVPGLRVEDVAVVGLSRPLPPSTGTARLTWVGPIAVARGSATKLRLLFVLSLALNGALAGGMLWFATRRRRPEEPPADGA
jgi:type III secretion protein J